MYTLEGEGRCEYEIKKSIFLGYARDAKSVKDAETYLKMLKKKHPGASHYCYCWYVKEEGRDAKKESDDGEPAKSAGCIISNVIRQRQLLNVIVVVIRYFGGTKLGLGGLRRAYNKASTLAVANATTVPYRNYLKLDLCCKYEDADKIKYLLNKYQKTSESFADTVNLSYMIPEDTKKDVTDSLLNLTKGKIKIKI